MIAVSGSRPLRNGAIVAPAARLTGRPATLISEDGGRA